jgi:hypothetical protein
MMTRHVINTGCPFFEAVNTVTVMACPGECKLSVQYKSRVQQKDKDNIPCCGVYKKETGCVEG